MSIRFPKDCKTREQRSAHAARVAAIRWDRHHVAKSPPAWIGGLIFDGPLAADIPMRLDLYAIEGERKWTGVTDGRILPDRLSERTVLRLVRTLLRTPRSGCPTKPDRFTPSLGTENRRSGFCINLRIGGGHASGKEGLT